MKKLSQPILGASSNLLGICFLLVSYVKQANLSSRTYLDEFLLIPILSFFGACLFSYISLRSGSEKKAEKMETISDYFFLIGLSSIALVAIIFTLEIIL